MGAQGDTSNTIRRLIPLTFGLIETNLPHSSDILLFYISILLFIYFTIKTYDLRTLEDTAI